LPLPSAPAALRAALFAGASFSAAFPTLARAADDDGALAELVVTAERRSESILKVPVAVSAISGDDLDRRHLAHVSDLSARLPNVEVSSPRGSSLSDVVIRGVGVANDFSINQASPVGIYLDDSYMASRTFSAAQAYDLDRVEVLRGPQGTLFGRNTTGGLINFITRRPDLSGDNGRLEAGYGAYDDVRLQGALEHTFAPGVFGVRIAGTFQRHDGYYRNIAPGQPDVDDLKTYAGRIEARWVPVDGLDVTAKAYGQRDDNSQWSNRIRLVGDLHETPRSPYKVDLTPGDFATSSSGAQLKVEAARPGRWALTHLTSYDRGRLRLDDVDLDGRSTGPDVFGFTSQTQRARFKQVNEELRLRYDAPDLKVVVGAYYGRDEVRDDERYDLFTVFPVSPRFRYEQDRVSKAAFAQVDYTLVPNLTLTGGIRFTHDSNAYRHGHADVGIPVVPGGVINTIPGAGSPLCPGLVCPDGEQPTVRGRNNAVTGRLAVKYALPSGGVVYASYNHGYRAGAYDGIAYLSTAQLAYVKPETVDAFEAGAKGRFLDGRAQVSLAAFYNDYRDQQVNFVRSVTTALGPFPVNILDNVPQAHTMGLEFEGELAATDAVRFHATAGLLKANYAQGSVVAGQDLSHNRLPYSPRFSGAAGFDWTVGRVLDGEVVLAPLVVHSSGYFFDPPNVPQVATSGFTRVNANLSWTRDGYAVRLWANNLFNEKYNTYGIDLAANTGNYAYVGAPPRTYGVTVSRDFCAGTPTWTASPWPRRRMCRPSSSSTSTSMPTRGSARMCTPPTPRCCARRPTSSGPRATAATGWCAASRPPRPSCTTTSTSRRARCTSRASPTIRSSCRSASTRRRARRSGSR
jgi:outer membrane receptor protein involved in Fe transport